jgi:GNAT superfamily N-acetyltransferase
MNRQDAKIARGVKIRRATVEDAELLCRLNASVQHLHVEARPDMFKPHAVTSEMIADYRSRLSDEAVYVFIGEVNNKPFGYILAQLVERPENPYTFRKPFVLVDQMSVNPVHQSKGYGDLMMQRVFDLARSHGIATVLLTVWAFNKRAIAFYERQGFAARDIRMEASVE